MGESDWNARAIETIFDPELFVTLRARTANQAAQLARAARPDMVVLLGDPDEPAFLDACRSLLREAVFSPSCPIIVLAPHPTTRQGRLQFQRLGAWFVVDEPVDGESVAILGERLLSSRREVQRIEELVLIDEITGLYNERGLMRRATELGARAGRLHEPFAAIAVRPLIDAEPAADTTGRVAVSRILPHFAAVLRATVRSSDAIGYLGNREFCVLATPIGGAEAVHLAERMRSAMEAAPLVTGGAIRRPSAITAVAAVADFSHATASPASLVARVLSSIRNDAGITPGVRLIDGPVAPTI
jgi:diguanylate cyclase (GGDEF)-like protein